MEEFQFGANILENLTTGMYRNPLILYREYIQNSCDSIDKAVAKGLYPSIEQGKIEIWLNTDTRTIEIEDNGTGIPEKDFARVLGNIADSDKMLGEDKGFRGIGRLCGLAYCNRLEFQSKSAGENKISVLSCDAQKMRALLAEHQSKQKRYLASDILKEVYSFSSKVDTDIDKHFFKVVLYDVNELSDNILNITLIKDYLSFVAPVPYQNSFIFRKSIYDYVKNLGVHIDEYSISVNSEPIVKKYVTVLKEKTGQKYDDVEGVSFKEFYDDNRNLVAWMWVGVYQFKQAIPKNNLMRGLRLRKENIQIGDEDALQKLFKEDRGNSYFIGEVFALDDNLIPNSQRDYFNQNLAREKFENLLKQYFNDDLYKTYYNASTINSGYNKIEKFETLQAEFLETERTGFAGIEHRTKKEDELEKAKLDAQKARAEIDKKISKANSDTPLFNQVANIIQKKREEHNKQPNSPTATSLPTPPNNDTEDKYGKKQNWRVDKLARLNKQERKLVGRIFDVIFTVTDKVTAEKIVTKIEETLK